MPENTARATGPLAHHATDARIRILIDGPIGHLVIDNPKRRNAVSLAMWQAIPSAVDALAQHPDVRVVVVRGAGERAFVSGADISEFASIRRDVSTARAYEAASATAFAAVKRIEQPTIAMIRGFCLGAGFGLAIACDLRIASKDAVFGIPAARLGIAYPVDRYGDVVSAIGVQAAKLLFYSASRIDADEALRSGLVAAVHPEALLEDEVHRLAFKIACNAPLTIRAAKATIDAVVEGKSAEYRESLSRRVEACFESDDFVEGRSAFLDKRKPIFEGH